MAALGRIKSRRRRVARGRAGGAGVVAQRDEPTVGDAVQRSGSGAGSLAAPPVGRGHLRRKQRAPRDGMELLYSCVENDGRLMTVSREFENFALLGEELQRRIPHRRVVGCRRGPSPTTSADGSHPRISPANRAMLTLELPYWRVICNQYPPWSPLSDQVLDATSRFISFQKNDQRSRSMPRAVGAYANRNVASANDSA